MLDWTYVDSPVVDLLLAAALIHANQCETETDLASKRRYKLIFVWLLCYDFFFQYSVRVFRFNCVEMDFGKKSVVTVCESGAVIKPN